MRNWKLNEKRKLVGWVLMALLVLGVAWWFSPGLPVLFGPWAWSGQIQCGQTLFVHDWHPNDELAGGDGLGPVFNGRSCVACHFQGGVGGAGESKGDVRAYHTKPTKDRPEPVSGLIHLASINKDWQESTTLLRQLYPIIKGQTTQRRDGHCVYTETIPDFDPLVIQNLNATSLFGAGWIDLIPSKAIVHHFRIQSFAGTWAEVMETQFNSRPVGRPRVLSDGRIGKFGWKAQFATLEEFVAAACANELGLSTPISDQPAPLAAPHYTAPGTDMSWRQLRDLSAFVTTLPRPIEAIPEDESQAQQAILGKSLFSSIGCAACHLPDLAGVKGIYSDFLLHDVDTNHDGAHNANSGYGPPNPQEIPQLSHREPLANEWKTPPLWGVADSAPYFHDGGVKTLRAAIVRHRGDATSVTRAFSRLKVDEQEALIAFLKTLRAPAQAVLPPKVQEPALVTNPTGAMLAKQNR